jgi:phosphoglycolate phosphatase-like HAD superfamily hydrolase
LGFDFDLTLADSRLSIIESLIAAAKSFSIDESLVKALPIGELTLTQIAKKLKVQDIEEFSNYFKAYYSNVGYKSSFLTPNVIETLEFLSSQRAELILISAKSIETLTPSVKHLALDKHFSSVISVSSSGDKSPSIKSLGLNAYIGDTQADIDAANRVGVFSIHFNGINAKHVRDYSRSISNFKELIPLMQEAQKTPSFFEN